MTSRLSRAQWEMLELADRGQGGWTVAVGANSERTAAILEKRGLVTRDAHYVYVTDEGRRVLQGARDV